MKKILQLLLVVVLIFCCVGCKEDQEGDNPLIPPEPSPGPSVKEQIIKSKLLLIDTENNYIELLDCNKTQLSKNVQIKKYLNNQLQAASIEDLMIGMDNLYVKSVGEEITQILIDGNPIFNRIRVAIRNSINNIADNATLYHDQITIKVNKATSIRTYDGSASYNINAGSTINFYCKNNSISFYIDNILYTSTKRLIINETDTEITVSSISRGVGTPTYSGNLEIAMSNNRLILINDVLMEDYLLKVVPSEMPASWHIEALKAQAIAARTYAYKEIYNKKYLREGYVVDDSESSQVYNNQNKQNSTTTAVTLTKGQTMFYNNEPIVAYYYSCSSGLTGNGNEVWIKNQVIEDIPYLHGKNFTSLEVNTEDEDSMLNFYKTINISDAPSASSSNFRWLITMTKENLRETLNVNIPLMVKGNESSYPILKNGEWVIDDFPSDIGTINKVFVSERGKSGVVVSLQIEASNVTFRIYNQYNIRFTIRPKDVSTTVMKYNANGFSNQYTSQSTNPSILTSGYFALECEGDTINFYGGGSGHGVGMCQYSANSLANNGKSCQEILKAFYDNIIFVDTSATYQPLKDVENIFKNFA